MPKKRDNRRDAKTSRQLQTPSVLICGAVVFFSFYVYFLNVFFLNVLGNLCVFLCIYAHFLLSFQAQSFVRVSFLPLWIIGKVQRKMKYVKEKQQKEKQSSPRAAGSARLLWVCTTFLVRLDHSYHCTREPFYYVAPFKISDYSFQNGRQMVTFIFLMKCCSPMELGA